MFRYRCIGQAFITILKNKWYNGSKRSEFDSCLLIPAVIKNELLILYFVSHAPNFIHVGDFHGSFSY